MAELRPYRRLGPAACAALGRALEVTLREWSGHWRGDRAAPRLVAVAPLAPTADAAGPWWVCARPTVAVAVACDGPTAALADALLGASGGEAHPLVAEVGEAALADLVRRVAHRAGGDDGPALAHERLPPGFVGGAHDGSVELALDCDGRGLRVRLDARAARALAPPTPRAARPPLVPFSGALGGQRVPLTVTLDLGTGGVAALGALAVGEVIATDIPLDAPFTLAIGARAVPCRLGRRGDRRAVLVER